MKTEFDKFIIDSNILIYLVDITDAIRHKKATDWLIENKNTFLAVSSQNIREFARVCFQKELLPPQDICEFIESFAARFTVFQDDFTDTKNAVLFCKGNVNLFWDAAIVSVMKRKGIETIFTENTKDFVVLGVKAINPLK